MSFTHALATNNYGAAQFIVDSNAANGTHTTIASAISAASSGDVILIRPGTYTEDLTLKAGVTLTGLGGNEYFPAVSIVGKCTFSSEGTAVVSSLSLVTNGDFAAELTGANSSTLFLDHCTIVSEDNTAISLTNSNSSSRIAIYFSLLNVNDTGFANFEASSASSISLFNCDAFNTGGSTTANTHSGSGQVLTRNTQLNIPLTITGTAFVSLQRTSIETTGVTSLTFTSAAQHGQILGCTFRSSTAIAMVQTGGLCIIDFLSVETSNATTITNTGTIFYGSIVNRTNTAFAFGGGGTETALPQV